MARAQESNIRSILSRMFSEKWIEAKSREVGFIKRSRKIDPVAFFWTLVFGFGLGNARTFAALRRCYQAEIGERIVPSSFYDRFTSRLRRLMKEALFHLLETASEPTRALKGQLAVFKDVVAIDSTVLKLHRMLAKKYAGTRVTTSKAAAKLNLAMSVTGRGPHTVRIASERVTEPKIMKIGRWVKGRLLMFDLGYYCYPVFCRIHKNGGYFISKVKTNTNPTLVRLLSSSQNNSLEVRGQKLRAYLSQLSEETVDAEAIGHYRIQTRNGKSTKAAKESFRFVALWNTEKQEYQVYITNVPPEKMDVTDIANTYCIRWEIELIFRQLKSQFRLSDFPSRKDVAVETLIFASLITLVVSRTFLVELRKRFPHLEERMPFERWSAIFSEFAVSILHSLLDNRRKTKQRKKSLLDLMFREAIDPNAVRSGGLIGKIETCMITKRYVFSKA